MNKLFLVLALATIGMLSCKKEAKPTSDLFGKWEISKRYNGNIRDSIYKPGNGNILQFNSDSTYKQYINGVLSQQGTFHIRKNANSAGQIPYSVLYLDSDINSEYLIILSQGILTLKPTMPDISTADYIKESN